MESSETQGERKHGKEIETKDRVKEQESEREREMSGLRFNVRKINQTNHYKRTADPQLDRQTAEATPA